MHRKIPALSSERFARLLERSGAQFVRQRRTDHAIYERTGHGRIWRAPVQMGKSELSPKYMKRVFRQLGYTDEEIDEALER